MTCAWPEQIQHFSARFLFSLTIFAPWCQTGFSSTNPRQSHRVHPVHAAEEPYPPARHWRPEEAEHAVGAAGWVGLIVLVRQYPHAVWMGVWFICLPSVYPLQSVPWRRPRATARSRQTTRLTAACTQTARAAPCRPSTAAPTPAQNQNRTSCPTERSYAWSPARLSHAGAPPPPPTPQTDSFCPAHPPPP